MRATSLYLALYYTTNNNTYVSHMGAGLILKTRARRRGGNNPPMKKRRKSCLQVDAGLLVEDVADMAGEGELNIGTAGQSSNLSAGHVHGGNDHDNIAAHGGDMQVDGGAHQLGNVDLAGDTGFQSDMLGPDAQNDILLGNVVLTVPAPTSILSPIN